MEESCDWGGIGFNMCLTSFVGSAPCHDEQDTQERLQAAQAEELSAGSMVGCLSFAPPLSSGAQLASLQHAVGGWIGTGRRK